MELILQKQHMTTTAGPGTSYPAGLFFSFAMSLRRRAGRLPQPASPALRHLAGILLCCLFLFSCSPVAPDAVVRLEATAVVSSDYIGNGAQWDPYQLDYGDGRMEISEADWQKLYDRLDFMRPQFIRMMINISSFLEDGVLVPEKNRAVMERMLDYCQQRGVTVMFGDWGWSVINRGQPSVNAKNMHHAVELLDYLVNERGYSCITYYNLINEPNGDWSATNTSHTLWMEAMHHFHEIMKEYALTEKVKMAGPDIAIWDERESWWIDSTATQLGEIVELYDIHTYPSKITVNSGEYSRIIRAYREKVPEGKRMVMGEIGFKFVEEADSVYLQENKRRANAAAHASPGDSQMFVYDYIYGIDMADALIQTVNEGFSGAVVWMMDDAMHSHQAPDKLKVWGFWNILGEERFGAAEEEVRPWYYAWSLLTRYLPAGSVIGGTVVTGDSRVRAITAGKEGRRMIAVVNVDKETKRIRLISDDLPSSDGWRKYIYHETTLRKEGDHRLLPNEEELTLDLSRGLSLEMLPESLIVFTNMP